MNWEEFKKAEEIFMKEYESCPPEDKLKLVSAFNAKWWPIYQEEVNKKVEEKKKTSLSKTLYPSR